MIKTEKYIKYPNQTLLDFLINQYGSVDYFFKLMDDANLSHSDDFYLIDRTIKLPLISPNPINTYFKNNGLVTVTGDLFNLTSNLIYNNDLTFKSFIFGEYNNDFSNDYTIEQGVQVVVVGYEGMTLTVEFSISNTGDVKDTFIGNLALDNGITILNKPISKEIYSNTTETIKVDFTDLAYGIYTITLTSSNPVINYSTDFGVLGKQHFTSNNDLSVDTLPPYSVGDTVTVSWSVINDGNRSGFYQGFSLYNNEYVYINEVIDVNETKTFTRDIVLYNTITTFTSSEEQLLTIITE